MIMSTFREISEFMSTFREISFDFRRTALLLWVEDLEKLSFPKYFALKNIYRPMHMLASWMVLLQNTVGVRVKKSFKFERIVLC